MHSWLCCRALQISDRDACSLSIKFLARSKPKSIYMADTIDLDSVCSMLAELNDKLQLGSTSPRSKALSVSFKDDALFSIDGEIAAAQRHQQLDSPGSFRSELDDDLILEEEERAPSWVAATCYRCGDPECVDLMYSRVRSGWCCRHFPVEATLFGVLMPLALAGYWLRDTTMVTEQTGAVDAGLDRWLLASCNLHRTCPLRQREPTTRRGSPPLPWQIARPLTSHMSLPLRPLRQRTSDLPPRQICGRQGY